MSYLDIYICDEYVTRINNNEKYIVISNTEFYKNKNSIDVETTLYENSRYTYFDTLTVNSTLIVNGDLNIQSSQ